MFLMDSLEWLVYFYWPSLTSCMTFWHVSAACMIVLEEKADKMSSFCVSNNIKPNGIYLAIEIVNVDGTHDRSA